MHSVVSDDMLLKPRAGSGVRVEAPKHVSAVVQQAWSLAQAGS